MNKVTTTQRFKEFNRVMHSNVESLKISAGDLVHDAAHMADLLERAEYFVEQSTKHPTPSIRMKALKLREDIKKFQENHT